jgi:hypothetical protein
MKQFLAASHSLNPFDLKARAPREARAASGHHSFSDCTLYSERCLRVPGGLAYLHPLLGALAPPLEGSAPRSPYFAVMGLALMMIALTGHLGGILSGIETP